MSRIAAMATSVASSALTTSTFRSGCTSGESRGAACRVASGERCRCVRRLPGPACAWSIVFGGCSSGYDFHSKVGGRSVVS